MPRDFDLPQPTPHQPGRESCKASVQGTQNIGKCPPGERLVQHRTDSLFGEMLLELYTVDGKKQKESWPNFFAQYPSDLVVLKTSNPKEIGRDEVVVRALGTKNETRLVSYIANVRRVLRAVQDSNLCIYGVLEPKGTKWCVG